MSTNGTTDTTTNETQIIIETEVPVVRIIREFDAPRDKVFRAHTDPELFAQWAGPREHENLIETLPSASWQTALGLGFVSAVFDNIPLTALALKQGGYDWGYLAYAVGFGGSMIWFGSSAGVALANQDPEAKSVGLWLRHGWHVALAYVVGFFIMLAILGWHPDTEHKKRVEAPLPAAAVPIT